MTLPGEPLKVYKCLKEDVCPGGPLSGLTSLSMSSHSRCPHNEIAIAGWQTLRNILSLRFVVTATVWHSISTLRVAVSKILPF